MEAHGFPIEAASKARESQANSAIATIKTY
jgi:hypothetical protein